MPKVSVIVPIYNVEKYIERCAVSLFEQTLDDLEYLFVNDCTPDRSMEILHEVLDRYPNRKPQVKIINMEKNSGQAAVRNKGLENVTGEYVIHCDSDDWVELDIYEKLYDKATQTKADIVVCDFYLEYGTSQQIEHFEPPKNHIDYIKYDKIPTWWCTWCRLISNELTSKHNISFIPGLNMFEDVCYNKRIYFYAKHIEYLNKPLYHYRCINMDSITNRLTANEYAEQLAKCYTHLNIWFYEKDIDFGLNQQFKINIRDGILRISDKWVSNHEFNTWKLIFPEVVPIILSDKSLSWIYRKCYAMASKGFYLPFKIYRWLSRLKS